MSPAFGMALGAAGAAAGVPMGGGGMPSLGLSSSVSSKSGDIGAPNTVYFGGFGTGAGGGDLAGGLAQYWPYILGGVLLLTILRKH